VILSQNYEKISIVSAWKKYGLNFSVVNSADVLFETWKGFEKQGKTWKNIAFHVFPVF